MNYQDVFSHIMAEAAWMDKKDYPVVKNPDAGHFVSEIGRL